MCANIAVAAPQAPSQSEYISLPQMNFYAFPTEQGFAEY